jgi:hypothetical protein
MAGGQQINSGQGTLVYTEGDVLAGSESTSAAGSVGRTALVPLRSRRAGGGTASRALIGSVAGGATGALSFAKGQTLSGHALTGVQGVLLYRGRATIGWTANPEPDLAGYRVYRGNTSGNTSVEVVDVGNVTTYQWNGLTPGQTHYFTVTAYDTSNNESAKSVEVSKAF